MQRIVTLPVRRAGLATAATLLLGLVSAGAAHAASYTVTTTNDSNDGSCTATLCSLRDAVVAADHAGGASTIAVPAGSYTLTIPSSAADDPTNGDLDILDGASVTLTGAGAGSTIINANATDRAFAVQSGAALSLAGVTIENGSSNPSGASTAPGSGGAVYNDGSLSVANSTLDQNQAVDGGDIYSDTGATSTTVTGSVLSNSFAGSTGQDVAGGIYLGGGTLDVSGTQFNTDQSYDDAGAIYVDSGPATITGSSFYDDGAGYAGAIEQTSGDLTITASTFTGDAADQPGGCGLCGSRRAATFLGPFGGAIGATGGTLTINGSHFTSNSAQVGGAIYTDAAALTIDRSQFSANNADSAGGIYAAGSTAVSIDHTTLDHNSGNYGQGGGLSLFNSGTSTITNTTIAYNEAGYGAGVYLANTPVTFTNDTIANNTAGVPNTCDANCGGGVNDPSQAQGGWVNTIIANNVGGNCDIPAGAADHGNNLDSDNTCFPSSDGATGDQTANPRLGSLQDNGGPAPTEALLAGSPAIDAGSNAACPSDDERGVSRPQGAACDIGAYEAAPAKLALTKSAPANGTTGIPITYTLTVTDGGPSPSSTTTVTDQLPAGETLYGATPSQGSCTSAGSPAKVTCDLGTVANGASATVALIAAEANPGSVTNTATATNDQGSSVTASAATSFAANTTSAKSPPSVITGPSNTIRQTRARITGTLGTSGFSTTYFFQVGTSRSYGRVTAAHVTTASGGVVANLAGLRPHTLYHYRLVGVNGAGSAFGRDRTFRTKGVSYQGRLILDSRFLHVRNGRVYARFTCQSTHACVFRFSIVIHARIANTTRYATLVFTTTRTQIKRIGAHRTVTESAVVNPAALSVLQGASGHHILGKLSTRPRTHQRGIIDIVSLLLG